MWNWISRADDLGQIVRNISSVKELKSLRDFLSDSKNTIHLRDRNIHDALKEIGSKINNMSMEEKINAIFDLLF